MLSGERVTSKRSPSRSRSPSPPSAKRAGRVSLAATQFAADDAESLREGRSMETWAALFRRFADDGEIHRDKLPKALEHVGVDHPVQSWIKEVNEKLFRY